MDYLPVLPIGKSTDLLAWDPCDDLFDDLLTLTSHDHVYILTTVKQILDLLRSFEAPDNCANLGRQLSDEFTDLLEAGVPLDADAKKIDRVPDELAESLNVLVSPLVPKIEKRYLTDRVFNARSDVLEAGPGKDRHGGRRMPEIGV